MKAPEGIKLPKDSESAANVFGGNRRRSISTIYPVEAGRIHKNTFQVQEKFEKLDNGVRFNIEKVAKPKFNHLKKDKKSKEYLFTKLKFDAANFYTESYAPMKPGSYYRDDNAKVKPENVRLEAISNTKNVVYSGGDGFFQAAVCAFAQHLPLVISPDDIWVLISYAFAKHVDLNSDELRENFVKHEGKKRIKIETGGGFRLSTTGQPDTGASAEEWETIVFSQFSEEIRKFIGDKTHGTVIADFSTTTPSTRAASEITLMAAMKDYFSFGMSTCCGIPEITLLGEEDDWVSIVERVKGLGELMTKEFSKYWLTNLLPVLEQFVEAFRGKVNYSFWQTMVKLRDTGGGSGSYSYISGWIQILFPYLDNGELNKKLRAWNEMYFDGPKPNEIPKIMSCAPVDWDYHGIKYDIHFMAGFMGYTQDREGRLQANIGWYVTHDPPKPSGLEMSLVQSEINDLIRGNFRRDDKNYKNKEWYTRVVELKEKEALLMKSLPKKEREIAQQQMKYRVKLD